MHMFAEITSTNDAIVRIAWVLCSVFVAGLAFAWLTRKR